MAMFGVGRVEEVHLHVGDGGRGRMDPCVSLMIGRYAGDMCRLTASAHAAAHPAA